MLKRLWVNGVAGPLLLVIHIIESEQLSIQFTAGVSDENEWKWVVLVHPVYRDPDKGECGSIGCVGLWNHVLMFKIISHGSFLQGELLGAKFLWWFCSFLESRFQKVILGGGGCRQFSAFDVGLQVPARFNFAPLISTSNSFGSLGFGTAQFCISVPTNQLWRSWSQQWAGWGWTIKSRATCCWLRSFVISAVWVVNLYQRELNSSWNSRFLAWEYFWTQLWTWMPSVNCGLEYFCPS